MVIYFNTRVFLCYSNLVSLMTVYFYTHTHTLNTNRTKRNSSMYLCMIHKPLYNLFFLFYNSLTSILILCSRKNNCLYCFVLLFMLKCYFLCLELFSSFVIFEALYNEIFTLKSNRFGWNKYDYTK